MFGKWSFGAREAQPEAFVPYLGHASENSILDDSGTLHAVLAVEGLPWETAAASALNGRVRGWAKLLRDLAATAGTHAAVTVSVHVVRSAADRAVYPAAECRSPFAAKLDDAYRRQLFGAVPLYRNELFVTVSLAPHASPSFRLRRLAGHRPAVTEDRLRRLDDAVALLVSGLSEYRPRRLGVRKGKRVGQRGRRGALFSEIAEAMRLVLYGERLPVPVVTGHLGSAIYCERVIVGAETIELRGPGRSRYMAMLGCKEYPESSWAGQFDAILSAPYACVLTQSFSLLPKVQARTVATRKQNQMTTAGDRAGHQAAELSVLAAQIEGNAVVMGSHHVSLAVFSDTPQKLADVAAEARRDLADGGAVVVREDRGLGAAFWAQLPGNGRYRVRPGVVTNRNMAAMAPLHNYPAGAAKGVWGGPVTVFRTSGGTALHYHFQPPPGVGAPDDVGNTLVVGPTGSGKSTWLGFVVAEAERTGARFVIFDYSKGLAILTRALGGTYLPLEMGRPTGFAPLRALTNSAEDIAFLEAWVTGLVTQGGGEAPTTEEKRLLSQGLAAVMAGPMEARTLSELRGFLGHSNREGIGARLERWCEGGALGWAFDGPADVLSLDAAVLGLDTTQLLDHTEVRGPAMAYAFHRIASLLDGRPLVLVVDEFWRALLDPAFASLANDKLKVIRKENGAVVLATQSARDVLRSPIAHTILEQCPSKVLFANNNAKREDHVDGLGLTDAEWRLVRDDMQGATRRFLLKQGAHSVVCELNLGTMLDDVAVISGRKGTVRLMDRLRAELGEDVDAWLPAFRAQWRAVKAEDAEDVEDAAELAELVA